MSFLELIKKGTACAPTNPTPLKRKTGNDPGSGPPRAHCCKTASLSVLLSSDRRQKE